MTLGQCKNTLLLYYVFQSFGQPFLKIIAECVTLMSYCFRFQSLKTHTLDMFKHMAAFVMAYSFTENGPGCHGDNAPVMVPMADMLNHHSDNNAHLEFAQEELRMVSTQPIKKVWYHI